MSAATHGYLEHRRTWPRRVRHVVCIRVGAAARHRRSPRHPRRDAQRDAPECRGGRGWRCPPGFVAADAGSARERRAEINGLRERPAGERDAVRRLPARSGPERASELLTVQAESGRRARGGLAAVKPGAYAAASSGASGARARRRRVGAGRDDAPGRRRPALRRGQRRRARGSQRARRRLRLRRRQRPRIRRGRRGRRVGVRRSRRALALDRGRAAHPGGGRIAYANGTLVVVTGDNVFGGGGTFAGLGAFRSTDGGATWQHATGVPSGVIAFKVAAGPHPSIFYAATGAGLFRSEDAGASFVNVELPVGPCAGKPPEAGCALANMVTDVAVQGPANGFGGTPGAVVAAVGWRAGNKTSQYGYVEAPGNGIYHSADGRGPSPRPGASRGVEQSRADRARRRHRPGAGPPLRLRAGLRRVAVQRRPAGRHAAQPGRAVPRRTSAASTCPRTSGRPGR